MSDDIKKPGQLQQQQEQQQQQQQQQDLKQEDPKRASKQKLENEVGLGLGLSPGLSLKDLEKGEVIRTHLWTPVTWHLTIAVLVVYIISLAAFIRFVDPTNFRRSQKCGHVTLLDVVGMEPGDVVEVQAVAGSSFNSLI